MDAQHGAPQLDAHTDLPQKSGEHLPYRWRLATRVAWTATVTIALAAVFGSLPGYLTGLEHTVHVSASGQLPATGRYLLDLIATLSSLGAVLVSFSLAGLLFWRKQADRMAVIVSFYLLFYAVGIAGPLENLEGILSDSFFRVVSRIGPIYSTVPTLWLMLLLPDGHFALAWTRWLAIGALGWIPLIFILPADWWIVLSDRWFYVGGFLWLLTMGMAIYAQLYRYRHVSNAAQRQQAKWVVFGLTSWIATTALLSVPHTLSFNLLPGLPTPWWVPVSTALWGLSLMIFPLSLVIAVLRYRLWEIDVVINRTLVYVTLTVMVVGVYMSVVTIFSQIFRTRENLFSSLLAAGLIAVIFHPLRERLQRRVNRLMFGQRDDPVTMITYLAERLESADSPEAILPALVQTIAYSLKLPYVALWVPQRDSRWTLESEAGRMPAHAGVEFISLHYQKQEIGRLAIAVRSPGESFSHADHRLFTTIAQLAATTVRAVQLSDEVQRSRQKLVTAREEERRRIRRDLHDGLGPVLASLALQADTAQDFVASAPEEARAILNDITDQAQAAIGDIRNLVYDLRPPALDELGLLGAIRQYVSSLQVSGLSFQVMAPDALPLLPAAVEVAAYRILQEGLNNVVRQASATHCSVRLNLKNGLYLEISDNGRGPGAHSPAGAGLHSMRERAAELGGRCTIEALPTGGTHVVAWFPFVQTG